jgi:hypothetical protein
MRLMSFALAAAALVLIAAPADAARKRSQVVVQSATRGEAGVVVRRSRTRVTVTRRSYLDAGTEVYPGSQRYHDYVFSPNYGSPAHFTLGPGRPDGLNTPGTEPLWIPSYHAPNWGY